MAEIEVRHQHGDRFLVRVRDHTFTVDQPVEAGGDDIGPTPTELFVTGLASCVGFYAERFLRRHEIDPQGLAVDCDYEMAPDRPARVASIQLRVILPDGFPDERRTALERVVAHCTVHNSLRTPPEVLVALATASRAEL